MQSIDQSRTIVTRTSGSGEPLVDPSTATLIREVVDDAKRLVNLEVALARNEMAREIREARAAAISFGASAVVAIMGLTMLFVAIALTFSAGPIPALIIGGILLVLAGCAGLVGMGFFPREPLVVTRHRLESEVRLMKERVA